MVDIANTSIEYKPYVSRILKGFKDLVPERGLKIYINYWSKTLSRGTYYDIPVGTIYDRVLKFKERSGVIEVFFDLKVLGEMVDGELGEKMLYFMQAELPKNEVLPSVLEIRESKVITSSLYFESDELIPLVKIDFNKFQVNLSREYKKGYENAFLNPTYTQDISRKILTRLSTNISIKLWYH